MTARFKYPLAALESLYAHRLEQARLALAQAQGRLAAHRREIHQQCQALQRHHADVSAAPAAAAGFDPARHAVVRAALAAMQGRLVAAYRHEQALNEWVDVCRANVLLAHRRSETLDRHKKSAAREFNLEATRGAQRQSDDAWSVRRGNHDSI